MAPGSCSSRLPANSSGSCSPRLSPRAHQAALFAAPVTLLGGLALVVQLLALGDRQQQLGAATLIEIELERDQRHALAIDRAHQLVDLPAMQQQLSRPLRLVIE